MKYKVLVSGGNTPIIDDFFVQLGDAFEVISTSTRFGDIIRHLKYFDPDAFVYCLYNESRDSLRQMTNIKASMRQSRVPFILIGAKNDCDQFEKIAVNVADLVLVKPFTAAVLQEKITFFLDDRREYQETYKQKAKEEENKEAEEELAAMEKAVEEALSPDADLSSLKKVLSSLEEALAGESSAVPEKEAVSEKEAASEKEAIPKKEPEQEAKPEERRHILVVDDDPIMLKMLKEHLHEQYDVATAVSGKIAMKFLERKTTDLILLDFEMPIENGPAVLEKIRENDSSKNIPVIFLTGVSEREKIQEALALKPQGYLLKPIDRDKLLDTIASFVG